MYVVQRPRGNNNVEEVLMQDDGNDYYACLVYTGDLPIKTNSYVVIVALITVRKYGGFKKKYSVKMTTSWFEGYTKQFIKVPLNNNATLEEKQSFILKNKKPTYPLHLTLAVIHISNSTACVDYFRSLAFNKDVQDIYLEQTNCLRNAEKVDYAIMGKNPGCFALCIDTGDVFKSVIHHFKHTLCLLLCEKLGLTREERLIDEKYNYIVLLDADGVDVLKMPWSIDESPICHVTLFTLFDLKRCNKPLFKEYEAAEDKLAFLSNLCGDPVKLMADK